MDVAEEPVAETIESNTVPEGKDITEGKPNDQEKTQAGEGAETEHTVGEHAEGKHIEGKQTETVEGEHVEGEEVKDEQAESEHVTDEHTDADQTELGDVEEKYLGEGEEMILEGGEDEQVEEEEDVKKEEAVVQVVEEEEVYVEEPPPDPAAPYNFSDSEERLKPRFELRPDQLAEVEQLWEEYQNYTPAYSDIKDYITEKELIYMLKALMLMTYTPEQLQELIEYCVRPPHPEGHITYEQFLKMITLRQREFPIEEELRAGLQVLDPDKTNMMDREYFKEVLSTMGHKMPPKQLDYLIKEVDITNDGTIGIEDVVGTMCVDLNTDDIIMLRNQLFPPDKPAVEDEDF